MSRENQIPRIPTYNLLGDHQTAGDARENAKRKRDSSGDIELDVGSAAHRKLEGETLQSVLCQSS